MSQSNGAVDIGYVDSLEWSYANPRLNRSTIHFEEYGNPAITVEIVNAAKRLFMHSSPHTIEAAIDSARIMLAAIAAHANGSLSVAEWDAALVSALRRKTVKASTRNSRYKICSLILREVARGRGQSIRLRNPFRPDSTPVPLANATSVRRAVNLARRDVALLWSRFTADSSAEDWPIIERARAFARRNGGVLPGFKRQTPLSVEFNRWVHQLNYHRTQRVGRRVLAHYCYATSEALIPIIFLIVHRLAGNVESVVALRRDCLREMPDPIYGSRFLVTMEKRRANRDLHYRLLDSNRFSVPSLIRMALTLTEPLVPLATPEHRHLLFLAPSHHRDVTSMHSIARMFPAYLAAAKISPGFTLQSLRPTRIVKTYTDTGDPFRARHEAKHANLSQTMEYLRRHEVEQFDESIIADTQGEMFERKASHDASAPNELRDASLPSHTCLDPAHPEHAEIENGLCMNLLWPLNDRHFVMPLEPRPVAFLLRDYAALKEARRNIPADRFDALYRPKMLLIEQQYLPQLSSSLTDAATALISSLPLALRLT
jgi:hypothetical protein